MESDKDHIEIGYVPDDSADIEKSEAHEKNPESDGAAKKKVTVKKIHHKIHELEEYLQKIGKERDEFKDKYLRTLAEMDNFRKRLKKEKEDFQKYALNDFLIDLLQILDNLERALKAKNIENERSIVSGVEIIHKQLLDLLKKYQVIEIDALGKRFDPTLHEALAKEERQGISEPVVLEVYQKGFTYHDKLIRPALTKVAVPISHQTADQPPDQ